MSGETYYHDHWVTIEEERLDRYELIFMWRPELAPLLEPAALAEGQTVIDLGCGPGHFALELARRVGPRGHVHGLDINEAFVARARAHAEAEGLADRVTFHQLTGERFPLDDALADRVICKNVLEYVPDLPGTLGEVRRVLRPDGLAHAIDSDWDFVVVEPWNPETVTAFFRAAGQAFREPNIGRRLPAAFRRAGFQEVQVAVESIVDTTGLTTIVLHNMASYIRELGGLSADRVDDLLAQAQSAVDRGEYLFVLPQFLITAAV